MTVHVLESVTELRLSPFCGWTLAKYPVHAVVEILEEAASEWVRGGERTERRHVRAHAIHHLIVTLFKFAELVLCARQCGALLLGVTATAALDGPRSTGGADGVHGCCCVALTITLHETLDGLTVPRDAAPVRHLVVRPDTRRAAKRKAVRFNMGAFGRLCSRGAAWCRATSRRVLRKASARLAGQAVECKRSWELVNILLDGLAACRAVLALVSIFHACTQTLTAAGVSTRKRNRISEECLTHRTNKVIHVAVRDLR